MLKTCLEHQRTSRASRSGTDEQGKEMPVASPERSSTIDSSFNGSGLDSQSNAANVDSFHHGPFTSPTPPSARQPRT